MSTSNDSIAQAGRGAYWQDLRVGQKLRTFRRTLTETDLVNFISVTGMLESIFIDVGYVGAISGRVVPAALTYSLIEGFIFQNVIQGVGLALLEVSLKAHAPARVGDTIWAIIEITDVRPSSKANRAVITSEVSVLNERDEKILSYSVKRLLAGDPARYPATA